MKSPWVGFNESGGRTQRIAAITRQELGNGQDDEVEWIFPTAARRGEHPSVAAMRPDDRAEKRRDQRHGHPPGIDAESQNHPGHGFGGEGDVGQPSRQSDGLEIAGRAGKAVGEQFENDGVGEIHHGRLTRSSVTP